MYDPEKKFTNKLLDSVSGTWRGHVRVVSGYPVISTPLGFFLEHVDGVGTKALLHWNNKSYSAAAVDAFAMNANDLAILGFKPLTLNCHLLVSLEKEEAIHGVVDKLSNICQEHGIIFTGGETAVLNTLKGMEVGVHMTGFTDRLINTPLETGDLVFAHPSNGVHSNGLTLARKVLDPEEWVDELTRPTTIYLDVLKKTSHLAKKRMHVTGGAFTKLRKILRPDLNVGIDLSQIKVPEIFNVLYREVSDSHQMLRTFNCGVGFVEIISSEHEDEFKELARKAVLMGEVKKGTGKVKVVSPFDSAEVIC
jgi:phosphoribosylformylglycinamidine cyclo-ligase